MKRLKDFTKDLDGQVMRWTEEKIDKEISKYEYLLDFIKKSNGCYLHIMRHPDLKHKLSKLKRKTDLIRIGFC